MKLRILFIALLASCIVNAKELTKSESLAIAQSYIRAAHEGDPYAQLVASDMYRQGWGVEHNEKLSNQWLEASASQNYAPAISELGRRKIFGEGYPRKTDEAIKHLELAASLGASEANVLLGTYYLGIKFEHEPLDKELGQETLLAAYNSGNSFGAYYLGFMYEFGLEPNPISYEEINFSQAIHWYTKAAEQQNSFAAGQLGLIYALPQNYNLNMEKAYFWFKVAENLGAKDWAEFRIDVELQLNSGARSKVTTKVENWLLIHNKSKQQGPAGGTR